MMWSASSCRTQKQWIRRLPRASNCCVISGPTTSFAGRAGARAQPISDNEGRAIRRRLSSLTAKHASALDKPPRIRKIHLSASGSNSVVECDLAKVEVASSNLVSRSKIRQQGRKLSDAALLSPFAFFPFERRRSRFLLKQTSVKLYTLT